MSCGKSAVKHKRNFRIKSPTKSFASLKKIVMPYQHQHIFRNIKYEKNKKKFCAT